MLKTILTLLAGAAIAFGQLNTMTQTTLSAATSASANPVTVASATGISAGSVLYVDKEAMTVQAVSGNRITVRRGMYGTAVNSHASGATVYAGNANWFYSYDPSGTCVLANTYVTPWINVSNGSVWTCASGSWSNGSGGGGGASLPTQTGNGGKYLTTDGTNASWAALSALPTQTGNNGKYLTTDGSNPSWATLPSFTAGAGLSLTGSEFSVDTAVVANRAMVQAGQDLYCAGSASATAQTCSLAATLTAYTTGMRLLWRSGAANTSGGLTLNIDGLGAKAIKVSDCTTDPGASALPSGQAYWLWYNGTNFCIASQVSVQRIFQTSTISYQGDASATRATMGWNMATSANGGVATNVMNYTGNAALSSTAGTFQFVDAATKCADYTWRVPANYISGLTFSIDGYSSTGGAAAVKIGTRILAIPSGTTANSGSLGTVAYTTPSLTASALRNVIPLSLDATSVGTIAAGSYVIVEVCREGADAADTSAATFTLTSSELSYLAAVQNY